jgi:hypothetical protein
MKRTALAAILAATLGIVATLAVQPSIPRCPEDSAGLAPAQGADFSNGRWARYVCLPAGDDHTTDWREPSWFPVQ